MTSEGQQEILSANNAKYLQVHSIFKSYDFTDPSGSLVLNGITFDVAKKSLTSIFGPNGSGKTTLLKIIGNILGADDGFVSIGNKPVGDANTSFVFQDYADTLMPWSTCMDNIAFPLKLKGWDKHKRREHAKKFVEEQLKLDIPILKYPYEISGGQKQMTAIARALIVTPDLLLMDEAFGSLDYSVRLQLQEKLLYIWSAIQNTILMVSHDVDQAVFLSDRIIILSKKPARVFDIIEVDLPRPRELKSLIVTETFQRIRSKVISRFLEAQQN